jgi:hypothetical protein
MPCRSRVGTADRFRQLTDIARSKNKSARAHADQGIDARQCLIDTYGGRRRYAGQRATGQTIGAGVIATDAYFKQIARRKCLPGGIDEVRPAAESAGWVRCRIWHTG